MVFFWEMPASSRALFQDGMLIMQTTILLPDCKVHFVSLQTHLSPASVLNTGLIPKEQFVLYPHYYGRKKNGPYTHTPNTTTACTPKTFYSKNGQRMPSRVFLPEWYHFIISLIIFWDQSSPSCPHTLGTSHHSLPPITSQTDALPSVPCNRGTEMSPQLK